MDYRRNQNSGDVRGDCLLVKKTIFQDYLADDIATELTHFENGLRDFQNCTCTLPRTLVQTRENKLSTSKKLSRKNPKSCKVVKMFNSRWSRNKSVKYCFFLFATWVFLFAPILNDTLRYALPQKYRISIGGAIVAQGCHPSRVLGPSRPRPTVNLTPFQRNEYVPKVSEQTIGASGPAEGPIYRDTPRYHNDLRPNWNPDIEFRDEERTNEDRMMTELCRSRLNELAIWVMNQWPGVKLRVTEGWKDPSTSSGFPSERVLHYEGRAVDITTSDQDRRKYPILARLAVEAGFDWVLYKTAYVHCSVKSHVMAEVRGEGCFPGESHVRIPGGESVRMDQLTPGTPVLSVDSNGKLIEDTILTFMDVSSDIYSGKQAARSFVSISTESGENLHLTRNHLVYTSKKEIFQNLTSSSQSVRSSSAVFAGNVQVGDYVFVTNLACTATVRPIKVKKVEQVAMTSGAYAPLTSQGTILVSGTMASCYAVIENDFLAHFVMTPVRKFYQLQHWLTSDSDWTKATITQQNSSDHFEVTTRNSEGISCYANFLYKVAYMIIPEPWFWGD